MKNDWLSFLTGATIASVIYYLLILVSGAVSESVWHERAVKSGHAEYYLDENHDRQWRWK